MIAQQKLSDTQDKSSLNAITSHCACQTLQVHFKGCTMSAARLFSIYKRFLWQCVIAMCFFSFFYVGAVHESIRLSARVASL